MELVFQRDGYCGLKCSVPESYNDPYELFLGVDLSVPTEFLASYNDVIQEIPQRPTTCFSKSPIVSPMWAHYASEHSGFVLEFDAEELKKCFEGLVIKDVSYRNDPDEGLAELLARVSVIKKPRYAHWLHGKVFSEAYFSKFLDWSYEQECRLVAMNDVTESVGDNDILYVPLSCLNSIVFGNKCPPEKIQLGTEKAKASGFSWYKLEIGKSYSVPYMTGQPDEVFIFQNSEIVQTEYICSSCSEPVEEEVELCPWCRITDSHRLDAARGNPFRILDHYGVLEQYLEDVSKIGK